MYIYLYIYIYIFFFSPASVLIMPSDLRRCDTCSGRFAKQYFRNSPECRLCVNSKRTQEALEEMRKERLVLKKQIEDLQEFVLSNIGVSPPSAEEGSLPAATSPANADFSASQDPLPASRDEGYQPVRNGARPKHAPKQLLTPTTFNRFQVLADHTESDSEVHHPAASNQSQVLANPIEDDFETRLVGDSMVRGQLVEFCGRSKNGRRRRYCYPGAGLNDITAVCDDVTKDADSNSLYIIHAGTNDVLRTRSEELLEKYRRMIQQYKSKTNANNIIISGILPRVGAQKAFYDKAFSTNNRLQNLCYQENVSFVNMWNHFYHDQYLFQKDGIHLNSVGAARFGRLLCDQVSLHRSKNAIQTHPTAQP